MITNPKTNKKIKINGRAYVRLLECGYKEINGKLVLARDEIIPDKYIMNPNTGKIIKKEGLVYKKLTMLEVVDNPSIHYNEWYILKIQFKNLFYYDKDIVNTISFSLGINNVHSVDGSGKTSIANIIIFALTGKTAKQNIHYENILNRDSNFGYVNIYLSINNVVYSIMRNIQKINDAYNYSVSIQTYNTESNKYDNLTSPQTIKLIRNLIADYSIISAFNIIDNSGRHFINRSDKDKLVIFNSIKYLMEDISIFKDNINIILDKFIKYKVKIDVFQNKLSISFNGFSVDELSGYERLVVKIAISESFMMLKNYNRGRLLIIDDNLDIHKLISSLNQRTTMIILTNNIIPEVKNIVKEENIISDIKEENIISDIKEDNIISDIKEDNIISDIKEDNIISDIKEDISKIISEIISKIISDKKEENIISDVKEDNIISKKKKDIIAEIIRLIIIFSQI